MWCEKHPSIPSSSVLKNESEIIVLSFAVLGSACQSLRAKQVQETF